MCFGADRGGREAVPGCVSRAARASRAEADRALCFPCETDPRVFLFQAFVSRRGALSAALDALPWLGGGLLPELPYHRPQRGWHPSRAPAPQRSRSTAYEVPGSHTRRGQRARVERGTAGPPLAAPGLGAAPGVPLRRAPVASRSPSEPRPRETRWASWSASAATASRRRPTTASPRRCRPLT